MRRKYEESWGKKWSRWLRSVDWEVGLLYLSIYFWGFCSGAFMVMIHHQHFLASLLENQ